MVLLSKDLAYLYALYLRYTYTLIGYGIPYAFKFFIGDKMTIIQSPIMFDNRNQMVFFSLKCKYFIYLKSLIQGIIMIKLITYFKMKNQAIRSLYYFLMLEDFPFYKIKRIFESLFYFIFQYRII